MKKRTYEDPAREMKRKTRKRRRHEERAGARIDVVFCFVLFSNVSVLSRARAFH